MTSAPLTTAKAPVIHATAIVAPGATVADSVSIGPYCVIGEQVTLGPGVTLEAHVVVGEYAILGGLSAVHQFVRIGRHAMVGGMSGVEQDVIPFGSVMGDRANLSGLNIIGLKRREFSRDDIHALRTAYRMIFADGGTMAERLKEVAGQFADNEVVMDVVDFIRADSSRPVCQPKAPVR